MLREQIEFRGLLLQMTTRDLMLRYKQTVMGVGWAVFMPLLNTAVFSVVFMRVAPIATPVPYPLYAYSGLWAWNFLASALRFSVISLTSNPNLVTKVFFPREIFPFSTILVALVDFAVGAVVLVALMAWYQIAPTASLWLLPVVIAIHVMFTAGVALLLAMGNLFYRDVKYLFEVGITIWMFASAVLYPVDAIGGKTGLILRLNPVTAILEGYRAALFGLPLSHPSALAAVGVVSVVLLLGSWMAFHRAEFDFAENL